MADPTATRAGTLGRHPRLVRLHDARARAAPFPPSGLTWVAVHPAHRRRGLADLDDRRPLRAVARSRRGGQHPRGGRNRDLPALRLRHGCAHLHGDASARRSTLRDVDGADDLRVTIENADFATHLPVSSRSPPATRGQAPWSTFPPPMLADHFHDPEALREGHERKRFVIGARRARPRRVRALPAQARLRRMGRPTARRRDRGLGDATTAASSAPLVVGLADLDLMTSVRRSTGAARRSARLTSRTTCAGSACACATRCGCASSTCPPRSRPAPTARTSTSRSRSTTPAFAENAHAWRTASRRTARARVARAERDVAGRRAHRIQDLSSAYLGGTALDVARRAGLVERDSVRVAVAALSDAIRSRQAPRSTFMF